MPSNAKGVTTPALAGIARPLRLALLTVFLLHGCATQPRWVAAYQDCQEQVALLGSVLGPADQGDEVSRTVDALAEEVGGAVCEAIRQVCEPDPNNQACRLVVEQYEYGLLSQ
jgi:hypothetical protein